MTKPNEGFQQSYLIVANKKQSGAGLCQQKDN